MNTKTPLPAPERTGAGRRYDWIAIHEGWRAGQGAEHLAEAFGLKPKTITDRCGWIDQHFPPPAPARMIAELNRRLEAALAALDAGDAGKAERQAKTIAALIKAGRDLKHWSETMTHTDKGGASAVNTEESAGDERDYYAELDRRLDRLAEHLRAKGVGAHSDPSGGEAPRDELALLGAH
ncbi:hypothetical protein [Oceanicaulis sp. UBA2681]|uniref:hypothetical protein n=1 Tax=Oceanicaulis sp. UBA2681 TaxID=1947007 RepID=UPI0023527245|nr:hypothetical protein [Oceanicaulis sp. UBA2681]